MNSIKYCTKLKKKLWILVLSNSFENWFCKLEENSFCFVFPEKVVYFTNNTTQNILNCKNNAPCWICIFFWLYGIILRFCVFKLIFLLIRIIFAEFLKGLIVMWIFLEKNGKNIILGHIAFCIVVFQQISLYLWPAWCTKSENNSPFDFSLKAF